MEHLEINERRTVSSKESALIFEVQDFQKGKLKVIKRSQVHIFRALVLLAGLICGS